MGDTADLRLDWTSSVSIWKTWMSAPRLLAKMRAGQLRQVKVHFPGELSQGLSLDSGLACLQLAQPVREAKWQQRHDNPSPAVSALRGLETQLPPTAGGAQPADSQMGSFARAVSEPPPSFPGEIYGKVQTGMILQNGQRCLALSLSLSNIWWSVQHTGLCSCNKDLALPHTRHKSKPQIHQRPKQDGFSPLSHTRHKSEPKLFRHLTISNKSTKHSKENLGENRCHLGLGRDFLF